MWEVRSVNGRGLDIRLRLPSTFEALEQPVRKAIQSRLTRGSVSASLNVTRQTGAIRVSINEDVLGEILKAAEVVQAKAKDCAPPRIDGLLALKGVLETIEQSDDEETQKAVEQSVLDGLNAALDHLIETRSSEGQRLTDVVTTQLGEIATLTKTIETSPWRTPDAIKARLNEQVARLVATDQGLDDSRLHQEAVILATRADVEEEVKRLGAHISAARDLMEAEQAVGRQLDFLAQEFNREANTICSKAGANDISQAGLALKTVIDQLREQVQNIE